MKKVLTTIGIIISGVISVLLAQYFVRKFYKRWNHKDYIELEWEPENKPWV